MDIDVLEVHSTSAKEIVNWMKQLGLCQLIKTPTRYSENKDICLDIVFTNWDIVAKSGVCNINISDHQTILLTTRKVKFLKQKCMLYLPKPGCDVTGQRIGNPYKGFSL